MNVLRPGSEVLARIQREFNNLLRIRQDGDRPISVTCFFEEFRVPVVGEVRIIDWFPLRLYAAFTITVCEFNIVYKGSDANLKTRLFQGIQLSYMATKRMASMPVI